MSEDDRPRYRHYFRCRQCATRFHVDRLTSDPAKVKTPRCPRKACGGKAKESHVPDLGLDVAAGKFPMTPSVHATAFDTALKFVAEDQGVTNILDHRRPGESSAPPLPSHLQKQADSFWGGGQKQKTRTVRADLSPIYGERAISAQAGSPVMGQNFSAATSPGVAPILTSKAPGSSPVPEHRVIGSFNPK
jgi:hypothetical protein